MTDPERDELLRRIEDLERSNRRWKTVALATDAVLALFLVVALAWGLSTTLRWQAHLEQTRQAEAEARMRAEQALYYQLIATQQAERLHQAEKGEKAP